MAVYRRMFVVQNVVSIHRLFLQTLELARVADRQLSASGLPPQNVALIAAVNTAYADYKKGLDSIAVRAAVTANSRIREVLANTQVRTDTGLSPHLRDRIVSRPLPPIAGFVTGAVGIADEAVLERAGGASGWAAYWKAQEYGTGSREVRTIIGNMLRGYFYDRGFTGPTVPAQALFRHHPVFAPGPPIGGRTPGLGFGRGIVQRDIVGRHFVQKGADAAQAEYLASMRALETATIAELSGISGARARVP